MVSFSTLARNFCLLFTWAHLDNDGPGPDPGPYRVFRHQKERSHWVDPDEEPEEVPVYEARIPPACIFVPRIEVLTPGHIDCTYYGKEIHVETCDVMAERCYYDERKFIPSSFLVFSFSS